MTTFLLILRKLMSIERSQNLHLKIFLDRSFVGMFAIASSLNELFDPEFLVHPSDLHD